ncbi:MAG TPA: hypothetical protein IAD11_01365 [Candidatus Stercorousia faecigallinarum]|nr:hypothetical protein [Candidatus Stercorousia faecigallinarum]
MDILKVFVIIAFIIATVCTIKFHPEMHHPMIIEDADFKLTRISDTLSAKNIPVSQPAKSPPVRQNEIKIQPQPVQSRTEYIKTEEVKPVKSEKRIKPETTPEDTSQIELLQQIIKEAEKEIEPHVSEHTQTAQKPKQQNSNFKNPYMTEQEEIIAWNRWRSNIQNQIMKDSNIDYAPLGTLFLFTFVVDKYGNVSNIKVECSNPAFLDVARNNVKPAIAKLQKKPILNFPRGTQRTSTVVTGLFLIGTQERYSTPNDFSDYERVTY